MYQSSRFLHRYRQSDPQTPTENPRRAVGLEGLYFPILKCGVRRSSHCDIEEMNPASIHDDAGSIPELAQLGKDLALL